MLGLYQVMIYLACLYLVFKGVLIFQVAYTSPNTEKKKQAMTIGLVMVVVSLVAAAFFVWATEIQIDSLRTGVDSVVK